MKKLISAVTAMTMAASIVSSMAPSVFAADSTKTFSLEAFAAAGSKYDAMGNSITVSQADIDAGSVTIPCALYLDEASVPADVIEHEKGILKAQLAEQDKLLNESQAFSAHEVAKSNPKKTFLNFRNNLLMLYKNLPDKDLKRVMVIRWFLDYLAAWQTLLLNHNFADFLAIYKARRAFRVMCRNIERGQHEDKKLLAPYSILVKYYLKHKRKFSEL